MANSSITLYYVSSGAQWELLPHKLFVIEDIESYLSTKTKNTISSFQYIKPQLEISITVDLSQTYAEPLNASYKYVKIENSDQTGQYYYYFVKNTIWRSKSSVRFDLVMDVLNTFKEETHYNFKPNTRIIREHKDRFVPKNISVVLEYSILSSAGSLSVNDIVRVFYEVGGITRDVIVGTITDIDSDFCVISIANTYNLENVKKGFATTANSWWIYYDEYNYIQMGDWDVSFEYDIFRNIDYINENINPSLQCGNSKGKIIDNTKSLLDCDWYLLYRNQYDPSDSLVNPVECYLIPSKDREVDAGIITAGRLTATSLQMSYWYAIGLGDKGYTASTNVSITLDNGTVLSPSVSTNDQRNVIIKRNSDNTMTVYVVYGEVASGTGTATKFEGSWQCNYLTFSSMPITLRYGLTEPTGRSYEIRDKITGGAWLVGLLTLTNTTNPAYIDNFKKIDKTDAKNIKLIKIPYAPYDFTITSNKLVVSSDSNWDYVKLTQTSGSVIYALKLNDLNTQLRGTLSLSIVSKNPLFNLKPSISTPSINHKRLGINYESKLFNSEFYRPTYVYDSFSYVIQLEKLDIDYYTSSRDLTVYFDMTKTINSRFMFTFDSLEFKIAAESYAKYMPIARNNEEVLYNVPYINYVKTGLNYDVKAKNLSNASNWIGAGLSVAGVAASLALPSAPLKALGVATALISMAMTTKNAVVSTIQNEENFQRKQAELKNQTASVAGSDDVDLMSIYAENRLKYLIYEPNEIMKNMLYDLFFYAGYASNRLGLPNHNTRYNFDYLEADAVLEKVANIPDDCLEELVNAFKNGVSYIHKTSRSGAVKWDMKQEYENWEKVLL